MHAAPTSHPRHHDDDHLHLNHVDASPHGLTCLDKDRDGDIPNSTNNDGSHPPTSPDAHVFDITSHGRTSSDTSFNDSDGDDDAEDADLVIDTPSEKPVTWASLPKKGQLAILTFARLTEPCSPSIPDITLSPTNTVPSP